MVGLKDFQFTYDTYQDVRRNLFKYSVPFLICAGFFAYWMVLPPSHREFVDAQFSRFRAQAWLKGLTGVLVFGVTAFLVTEILQVHDKWYDKYITRWRYYYATDFILPRLIHPFASRVSPRFHSVAAQNVAEFQEKLYYPFVGDRDGKIGKNKLVRFYEAVTVYWLTQLNEIVIVVLLGTVAFYRWAGPRDLTYMTTLLTSSIVLMAAFLLNRILVGYTLSKVRLATAEEIDEIIAHHSVDLESRLAALCQEFEIPYE